MSETRFAELSDKNPNVKIRMFQELEILRLNIFIIYQYITLSHYLFLKYQY